MQSKEQMPQDQDRGLSYIGKNFLVGTLLGLIPLFLGFLYCVFLGDNMDWDTFGTKFFVALPILSGILSAVFGKRFVTVLADFMSYLG
jgi:amino acid transporter